MAQTTNNPLMADLFLEYGVIPTEGTMNLLQKYGTYAAASAKHPSYAARCAAVGWTQQEFLKLTVFTAAWNDWVWKWHPFAITGSLASQACIIAPSGSYAVNANLDFSFGRYKGQGTFVYTQGGCGTTLYVDHANWIKNPNDKRIFKSGSWGMEGGLAYVESVVIEGFRLDGMAGDWNDPSYESSGVALWDGGETSRLMDLYLLNFNNFGLELVRGTPVYGENISIFQNNIGGIGLIGGEGATYTFTNISGDDCPTSFFVRPGHNRKGGCLLTVNGTKSETAITSQWQPWKGQMLLDGEGWIHAQFNGVSLANGYQYSDSMIRVKGDVNVSYVEVNNLRVFGQRRTILHDVLNKKKWLFDKGSWMNPYKSFKWISVDGGVLQAFYGTPMVTGATYDGRLGSLDADPVTGAQIGKFDDTLGLPRFSYTGSTPTVPAAITGITISSNVNSLNENATASLTSVVTGTGAFDPSTIWNVMTLNGGTVANSNTNGTQAIYTAPAVNADMSVTIKGTSAVDATKSGTITLSVKNVVATPPTISSVTVTSTTSQPVEGTSTLLTATVNGTGTFNSNVTWSIVSGGGTLSSVSGNQVNYTAPMVTTDATVVVRATCVGDTSKATTTTLTVKNVVVAPPTPMPNIDPSKIGIVVNDDVAGSMAIANEYMSRWGVPATNLVRVNLGTADSVAPAAAGTARTKINATLPSSVQWLALCWDKPSRVNNTNAITWAITNGYSNVTLSTSLPTNPMFGYTGSAPFTDRGVRPSMMVYDIALVQRARAAHAKKPTGTVYMLAANDQNGSPRGSSRVSQMSALNNSTAYSGLTFQYTDARSGAMGEGPNNNILGKPNMLMYFNGMYKIYGMETNTVLAGAVGDYVTSTSGYLPDGAGQTPITYLLQNKFVGSLGTVTEPWQSIAGASPGCLVEQFTNIQTFVPLYWGGRSLVDAYWKSVKWPARTLMLGDPLVAPWGKEVTGTVPVYGCTDPTALNYNPSATANDGSCVYNTSDPNLLAKYSFESSSSPLLLKSDMGADVMQSIVWKQGKVAGGKFTSDNYNVTYPMSLAGVGKVVFTNLTIGANASYSNISNAIAIFPDGANYKLVQMPSQVDLIRNIVPNVAIPSLTVTFTSSVDLTCFIGNGNEQSNNAAPVSMDAVEFRK